MISYWLRTWSCISIGIEIKTRERNWTSIAGTYRNYCEINQNLTHFPKELTNYNEANTKGSAPATASNISSTTSVILPTGLARFMWALRDSWDNSSFHTVYNYFKSEKYCLLWNVPDIRFRKRIELHPDIDPNSSSDSYTTVPRQRC